MTTPIDLPALAASCEARAAAGEKPAMEWVGVDDYLDRYQGQKFCWLVQMSGQTIVGITRALDGHGGRESAWSVNHLPLAGTPRFAIERTIAAQLFAEALLAAATAPLHAARAYIVPPVSTPELTDAVKNIIYELQAENRRLNMAVDSLVSTRREPKLRPMADAPRDGTEVLAWANTRKEWRIIHARHGKYWNTSDGDEWLSSSFSGWLPLPPPPEGTT